MTGKRQRQAKRRWLASHCEFCDLRAPPPRLVRVVRLMLFTVTGAPLHTNGHILARSNLVDSATPRACVVSWIFREWCRGEGWGVVNGWEGGYCEGGQSDVMQGRGKGAVQGQGIGVVQGRGMGVVQGRGKGVVQGRGKGVKQGRGKAWGINLWSKGIDISTYGVDACILIYVVHTVRHISID